MMGKLLKSLSLVLAVIIVIPSVAITSVSASDALHTIDTETDLNYPVYVVAGAKHLCGVDWEGDDKEAPQNIMTYADGVYIKVFKDVEPAEHIQFKVVENLADGTENWFGDASGYNIAFDVVTTCDVTVTMTTDKVISVTGEGVSVETDAEIDAMYAVGNGDWYEGDPWLNGVNWDPSAEINKMKEISPKVYTITFENVEGPFDSYQVKFAANGEWIHSWGGTYVESGETFDAFYNGDNITVDVPYRLADVIIMLDLSDFDYATKTGGNITITVVGKNVGDFVVGDVNCDGKFNVNDITYLQMHLAHYKKQDGSPMIDTSDKNMFNVADVNGDENIDILDVTNIQRKLSKSV